MFSKSAYTVNVMHTIVRVFSNLTDFQKSVVKLTSCIFEIAFTNGDSSRFRIRTSFFVGDFAFSLSFFCFFSLS